MRINMWGLGSKVMTYSALMLSFTNKLSESFMLPIPSTITSSNTISTKQTPITTSMQQTDDSTLSNESITSSRRKMLTFFLLQASSILVSSNALAEDVEIRGTKVDPLNGLAFNYRGSDYGGLDSSTLDEPSISYTDFLSKLDKGEVEFVKFLAPDGDVAYATLKDAEKPIRIGEGYPVEQHDGWSSPAFAIRSVKEKGVPYKFIVPGLAAYK